MSVSIISITVLCLLLPVVGAAGSSTTSRGKSLTVVSSGQMDLAGLADDVPLFMLRTTMAHMVDKGTMFDAFSERPVVRREPKKSPVIVEPVKATIELKGKKDAKVFALDHDGRKPADAKPLPVEQTKDGLRFTVDGNQTKTVYYVVEF